MNDIATQIARNAKGLRKAHKLTLQEVADRGGLAKSYVWEIESGKNTNPSISVLAKLCTALGCSLDQIFGREVYMAPSLRPEAMRIAVEVDTLIRAALDYRKAKEPCGECHLQPGETCDICNAYQPPSSKVQKDISDE